MGRNSIQRSSIENYYGQVNRRLLLQRRMKMKKFSYFHIEHTEMVNCSSQLINSFNKSKNKKTKQHFFLELKFKFRVIKKVVHLIDVSCQQLTSLKHTCPLVKK